LDEKEGAMTKRHETMVSWKCALKDDPAPRRLFVFRLLDGLPDVPFRRPSWGGASVSIVMIAMALISGGATNVMAQPSVSQPVGPQPETLKPLYPFTPDELWARLLRIIALPDGEITPVAVDEALEVKLHLRNNTNIESAYVSYGAIAFKDGYFDVYLLGKKNKRFSFSFSWGHDPRLPYSSIPEIPPDMCIPITSSDSVIRSAGWTFSTRYKSDVEYVRNGKSRLFLTFRGNSGNRCLSGVVISDD
jgi:hypothetical protein